MRERRSDARDVRPREKDGPAPGASRPARDVVVASADASRWHAPVERTLLGYVVRDTSANGIRVSGVRVDGSRPLAPGDVLRIGDEELRFDADAPPAEPSCRPPRPPILSCALRWRRAGCRRERRSSRRWRSRTPVRTTDASDADTASTRGIVGLTGEQLRRLKGRR